MASGINFAYYVLYRFWINPLSHKFLIGTIELYRGQGKNWKQVWIFFPVMEPRIHIFLHIHLVWHKPNSLTAFFQLSLLLHGRNIVLLPILFPHRSQKIQRHSRSPSSLSLGWTTEKKKLKQAKKEINCKEVKFCTRPFNLVYILTISNFTYTDHVSSVQTYFNACAM